MGLVNHHPVGGDAGPGRDGGPGGPLGGVVHHQAVRDGLGIGAGQQVGGAEQPAGPGVDQGLRGLEAVAVCGVAGAIGAQGIALPGLQARYKRSPVSVPQVVQGNAVVRGGGQGVTVALPEQEHRHRRGMVRGD